MSEQKVTQTPPRFKLLIRTDAPDVTFEGELDQVLRLVPLLLDENEKVKVVIARIER